MEYNKIIHVVTRGNNRYKTMQVFNTFCIDIKLVTLAESDLGESSLESSSRNIQFHIKFGQHGIE